MPLRKSTGCVARKIRLCGVSWSMGGPPQRPGPALRAPRCPGACGGRAVCHRHATARAGSRRRAGDERGQTALPQSPAAGKGPRAGPPSVFSGRSDAIATVWPRARAARSRPRPRPDPTALEESARRDASASGASAQTARLIGPVGAPRATGSRSAWCPPYHQVSCIRMTVGHGTSRFTRARRKQSFNLIGVDDQRERARPGEPSSLLRDIEGMVRSDMPNILLSHNPDTFPRAAAMGIALSLAGHTHGGQIRFALGNHQWSPASLMTPFAVGLYRLPFGPAAHPARDATAARPQQSSFLYVNPGLGTFALPLRLGMPPEITVLTLRAAR